MSVAEPPRESTPGTPDSRRIVLVRHAKADWPDVADHDRPLAERGRKEAPVVGRWIADTGINPDLTLCSTSVRTRETWKLVVHELPHRPRTVYEDRIYEATLGDLLALLKETPDEVRDLLVVGHNPGMHALADALAGSAEGDTLARMNRGGYPTGAVAVVGLTGPWKTVEHGVGRLVRYWTPHD
ncbi:histidine phosphatase family protein [Streptomyces sp. F63]|uniref:SixA phosphatase family protein n=1 Tax=Streptomyces sp. F63 TaxID=2824887 RepID=UPI001B38586C|nr:histidine phosphatase family protein [Streptomyces sp. F63]MBQ0986738.1 histidine phosphatase family protein [Streptomyces sp. F63]